MRLDFQNFRRSTAQFTQDARVNPELSLREITRFDRRGALELVGDTFEEAFDLTLVALIVLARYEQKLARTNWDVDEM
jgi:hypothetical protein